MMLQILYPIILLINGLAAPASSSVTIEITNINKVEGQLLASIYNKKEGFPDGANSALSNEVVKITSKKTKITFSNLPAGTYAVALMHDKNFDNKMNYNLIGIPKEGFGFSGIKAGLFKPKFEKCAFKLDGKTSKTIKLQLYYP